MNNYIFKDLKIGQTESFTVTVTEEMVNSFTQLSGDTNPLHIDKSFSLKQGYMGY